MKLENVDLTLQAQVEKINVLNQINLSVYPGEAVGIVGPSGSGKTSLIMVMAGLEQATSGHIWIADKDITNWSEDALAAFRRDTIGIVFQSFHLIPTMTALENVAIPLELAGNKEAFEHAKEALDAVGLSHRVSHFPGQLSGGEQQRVALARAFATHPKLLLADEPTGNLDKENSRHVMNILFSLREKYNTTLLLITHDDHLAQRCERQIAIDNGCLVA